MRSITEKSELITNSRPCAASRELVIRGEGVMGDEILMSDEY
jgi:hypothetical protein